jgi:hypothetical protein
MATAWPFLRQPEVEEESGSQHKTQEGLKHVTVHLITDQTLLQTPTEDMTCTKAQRAEGGE